MTIDPKTGAMYVADGIGDKLYTIDKATGAATLIGSFGADGRDVSGLQFIGTTLYAVALKDAAPDVLLTVDRRQAQPLSLARRDQFWGHCCHGEGPGKRPCLHCRASD
jgi:hypothetical protein